MKGIELGLTEDGRLQITCLEHHRTHTDTAVFCCNDVMVRAISMAIRSTDSGYHARMLGMPSKPSHLSDWLFDIATAPLLLSQGKGYCPNFDLGTQPKPDPVDNGGAK